MAAALDRDPADRLPRLRDGLPFCLGVFIAMRVGLSLLAVIGVGDAQPDPSSLQPGSPPAPFVEPASPGWHNAWDGTQRWDAAWFLWIAQDGYGPDGRAAFFPGYPILFRAAAAPLGGDMAVGALVVSNLAFLASLTVLFGLTSSELGPDLARRAVALFACFPTSFFFLAPYSESLFLLATLLTFRWIRSERWGRGAAAAFAASLTRGEGVLLAPAMLVEAIRQHRDDGTPMLPRVAATGAALAGPLAYGLWWATRGQSVTTPLHAQGGWSREATFPLVTLVAGSTDAWEAIRAHAQLHLVVDAALATIVLVAAVSCVRRVSVSYAAYVGISLLVPLSYPSTYRPLLSIPRFAVVLFPLAWVGVETFRDRYVLAVTGAVLLGVQIWLALTFMRWEGWVL